MNESADENIGDPVVEDEQDRTQIPACVLISFTPINALAIMYLISGLVRVGDA